MARTRQWVWILAAIAFLIPGSLLADRTETITFVSWNLRNYLLNDHFQGSRKKFSSKPIAAREACVAILQEIRPDILGVCEIGAEEDLEEFRQRLGEVGLEYSETEFVRSSSDGVRHLALLSRYPIVERESQERLSYRIGDEPVAFRRGMLDVTIQVRDDYHLRCFGLHLKSKFQAPHDPDEELMRRNEAALARQRLSEILAESPKENLLVYGDFNDHPVSPVVRELKGVRGEPGYLSWLNLEAENGTAWTYHWKVNDAYSRFDYVLVSRWLSLEVRRKQSLLFESHLRPIASDHRPLVVKISPRDQPRSGE
ncbi:MAG: endonuclease/exonuclease/phosphatase family protein [Verrucomicrobiota bacterium]